MNRRSGATFVSHLLAAYLNELQIDVNYIENLYDDGYTYPLLKGYTEAPENYRSEFMLQRYKEMLQKESDILSIPKWKQGKNKLYCKESYSGSRAEKRDRAGF